MQELPWKDAAPNSVSQPRALMCCIGKLNFPPRKCKRIIASPRKTLFPFLDWNAIPDASNPNISCIK